MMVFFLYIFCVLNIIAGTLSFQAAATGSLYFAPGKRLTANARAFLFVLAVAHVTFAVMFGAGAI